MARDNTATPASAGPAAKTEAPGAKTEAAPASAVKTGEPIKTETAQEAVRTEMSPIKTEAAPTKADPTPKTEAGPTKADPVVESRVVSIKVEGDAGFIPELGDVLATTKSRSNGGAKIRANVGYTLVRDGVASLAGKNVPEQEAAILKILNGALSKSKPLISEPELNKLIVAAHAAKELKTKQDPWHIFRYYRTDLIKQGALRQVDFPTS